MTYNLRTRKPPRRDVLLTTCHDALPPDILRHMTFCGQDEKGPFRVGVFGYKRKCVGDYLDWEVAQ